MIDANNEQFPMSQLAIKNALLRAKKTQWLPYRANTMRFEVPPGKYIILPMTKSNQDLKFMLRVFSEMPVIMTSMDKPTTTESWDKFWDDSNFSEMPVNMTSIDEPITTESWDEFWDDSDFSEMPVNMTSMD